MNLSRTIDRLVQVRSSQDRRLTPQDIADKVRELGLAPAAAPMPVPGTQGRQWVIHARGSGDAFQRAEQTSPSVTVIPIPVSPRPPPG